MPGRTPRASKVSSLNVSDTETESICSLNVGDHDLTDVSTKPSTRTLVAKIEVADLMHPLEAKFQKRLDALESLLEERCGELCTNLRGESDWWRQRVARFDAHLNLHSQKIDDLYHAVDGVREGRHLMHPPSLPSGADELAPGSQDHILLLQTQMQNTTDSFQSFLQKEASKIEDMQHQMKTMRQDVNEVWQHIKSGRQEHCAQYQMLCETMECQLKSLIGKMGKACNNLESSWSGESNDLIKAADTNAPVQPLHVDKSASPPIAEPSYPVQWSPSAVPPTGHQPQLKEPLSALQSLHVDKSAAPPSAEPSYPAQWGASAVPPTGHQPKLKEPLRQPYRRTASAIEVGTQRQRPSEYHSGSQRCCRPGLLPTGRDMQAKRASPKTSPLRISRAQGGSAR